MQLAVMDDAAILGFLAKRHADVLATISSVPEFELRGTYSPDALLPVVKTITTLAADAKTQESIKTAATQIVTKLEALEAPVVDAPSDLRKSLEGIQAELAKRGARNSKSDAALIQGVHDSICKLGAACDPASPHAMNGTNVDALPPGSTANKADNAHKESGHMDPKLSKDAISSEGNKRGADVTNPSFPAESANAVNNDEAPDPSAAGAVAPESNKAKARPSWMDDQDGDDDATKTNKAKAREMFGKADEPLSLTKSQLAEMISMAVEKAVTSQSAGPAIKVGDTPVIPRVAPALLSVGKDGVTQKMQSSTEAADTLKKSVKRHAKDEQGQFAQYGDNDTCTLIKAIHANRVMVPEAELQSLGLIAR